MMKIRNVSGTLEESSRVISEMSPEERSEFYEELFKYDSGNPVPCTEGEIPLKQNRVA
jgi:hypothetical protein